MITVRYIPVSFRVLRGLSKNTTLTRTICQKELLTLRGKSEFESRPQNAILVFFRDLLSKFSTITPINFVWQPP